MASTRNENSAPSKVDENSKVNMNMNDKTNDTDVSYRGKEKRVHKV